MADKQFTHVCTSCRTPVLVQPKRPLRGFLQVVVMSVLALIVAVIFAQFGHANRVSPLGMGILGFALVFGGSYAWDHFQRKQARICPSCKSEALIPVASPEGLRIMKELGYSES